MHTAEFVRAFSGGALDDARMRRIGFGEASRSGVLIQRTKAEVAGGVPLPLISLFQHFEPAKQFYTSGHM